jgi:hypothetical protein
VFASKRFTVVQEQSYVRPVCSSDAISLEMAGEAESLSSCWVGGKCRMSPSASMNHWLADERDAGRKSDEDS